MSKIIGVIVHDLADADDEADRFYPVGTTEFADSTDRAIVCEVWNRMECITMGQFIGYFKNEV